MPPSLTHRALPVCIGLLAALALVVPMRFQRWAGAAEGALMVVLAPISGPSRALGTWLSPDRAPPEDDAIRVLEEHLEFNRAELLRERQENERLRQVIQDLQRGPALEGDLPVRRVQAGVVAASGRPGSGFLVARAGTRQGVTTESVATAHGLQLVGRVVAVEARTASIRPITAGGDALAAMIVLAEGSADGIKCTLRAAGDGTLRGPMADKRDSTGAPVEPPIGAAVRLDDPTWPRPARMLLVGRVERVDPAPEQPLRRIVTVRPTIEHLERIADVILWTPDTLPDDAP